jgi:Ca-activated chloride channel family protein
VTVAAADSAGVLTGTVVDRSNRTPLPGATVRLPGLGKDQSTDATGTFRFENLPSDTLQVTAAFVGYEPATEEVVMPDSGGLALSIGLQPRTSQLSEVVVTNDAARARQRMVGNAMRSPAQGIGPGRYAPPVDREGYDKIEETGFRRSVDAPLSTFSIDVDGAAYSNVRRFIRDGEEPPVDAVRIEEMLNYFPYDDPAPDEGSRHPFAVSMETAPAPWSEGHTLLRIGIQGEEIPETERPPTNLVFLLDVSGSMSSPNKLPLLKKSFRLLTEQLRPEDRVAIVVYAGASGTVLEPTPGNDKDAILGALNDLRAGGSTAGGAGIEAAYALAEENFDADGINRVILATDGDFNVGASSNAEMIRLIEEKRETGVFLTVLGFGTGNLQDSKMEQIANHGNGSYHYIDSALEARKVMVSEIGGTLQTIAKDVKLQVEFNPKHVGAYRLIGYENRRLAAEDFADDTKDAGELGAGHHVTALYELVPPGADSLAPEVPELKYQDREPSEAAASDEWLTLKLRYKQPDADESQLIQAPLVPSPTAEPSIDWQFAAAVAGFGMILRDSDYRGDVTLEQVRRLAENGRGDDPDGYRAGFIALLEDYRRMVGGEQDDASRPGR